MNHSLVVTASGLFFLVSFSVGLFVFVIVRRLVLARRQARFDRLYGEMEKDVLEAISLLSPEFSREAACRHKSHPHVLTQVLLDYSDRIVGEGKDHLKIIFDHAVKGHCLRHLASRRTSKRLQSVRLFIIFFDASESAFLLRLLDDKPIIKLAVVNALSRIPSPETLTYIFRAFEEDTGFAVQAYFNIMFSLGNRITPLVKAFLNKPLSVNKLALLVELVGAIPLRTLYPDVVALAGHPDKEIRLRVARALGRLLIPETGDTLVALSSDKAWEVKAQAVKSLGKMRNLGTTDILTRALFSPYWYVRYNAGHALAEMGEEGLRRLKEVAAQGDDKFARDMSVMVLNDLIVPGEAA
jgi:HEAT repeat protein